MGSKGPIPNSGSGTSDPRWQKAPPTSRIARSMRKVSGCAKTVGRPARRSTRITNSTGTARTVTGFRSGNTATMS
jgi:hypothetical protein